MKIKLPRISVVEILSPSSSPRASVSSSGSPRRRRSSAATANATATATSPITPCDLTAVSRPDTARQLRPCICHEILASCRCNELTRTKDGVCDMCLYGIHVEERGELFGAGYRKVSSPAAVHKKKKSVDHGGRGPLSAIMEQNDDVRRSVEAQALQAMRQRHNFIAPPSGMRLSLNPPPMDFDEHGMI